MLFSSVTFLGIFLPIILISYFFVRKISKNIYWQNLILCLFSLLFYAWGEPIYVFLMLISIIFNYIIAIKIDKQFLKKRKKILLTHAVMVNLLLIVFFKYGDFLISIINSLFSTSIGNLNIPLPIGISFYTFQIISYVIDVYRGNVKAQTNIMYLATYIALFPQLIAGPIVRYETIEEELEKRIITNSKIVEGIKRFIVGLAKKVIIANSVALVCDTIYESLTLSNNSIFLWIALLAYTVQIYFDFSGYSDMAIGLGKIFGFNFLENFNYPYVANSVTDFWKRWHISLSSWFKDYLYIPLGGNRVSTIKFIRNVLLVWLLTGLWHGANWNFILWGVYYGILLLIEKLIINKFIDKVPNYIRKFITFIIVMFGWLIFRTENLIDIKRIFLKMLIFDFNDFFSLLAENANLLVGMTYIVIGLFLSTTIIRRLDEKLKKYNWWYYISAILTLLLLFLCFAYLLSSSYNPFIYFRF